MEIVKFWQEQIQNWLIKKSDVYDLEKATVIHRISYWISLFHSTTTVTVKQSYPGSSEILYIIYSIFNVNVSIAHPRSMFHSDIAQRAAYIHGLLILSEVNLVPVPNNSGVDFDRDRVREDRIRGHRVEGTLRILDESLYHITYMTYINVFS